MGFKMSELKNNSLYDRVNKLLVSYEWSDCSFSVHGKNFKAHKLILGISSPVFEAMFYGPLSTNGPIVITDIDPNIFQTLLKYIYTDQVQIHSIEEAYDLLYVSRKYIIDYLTETCISYIQSNMSIDNVVSILNYPDHMQDNQIITKALKLFCRHANYLLNEYKYSITAMCMQKILKCKEMNIIEKDLIKNVFDWTDIICEQNEIVSTFENRRDVLINNGLFRLLRFFVLSINELEELTMCKSNLLLNNEQEKIKDTLSLMFKSPEKIEKDIFSFFSTLISPRKSIKYQWFLCHRPPIRSESPLIIDPTNFTIHTRIKSKKSTFINSLSVESRMAPVIIYCSNIPKTYLEQFSVTVLCEADNSIIKKIDLNNNEDYDSHCTIDLNEPLLLKKDIWYKISFTWPQTNTFFHYSYGVQSRDTFYNNGKVMFEFDDNLAISDNCGSFLRGLKFCV